MKNIKSDKFRKTSTGEIKDIKKLNVVKGSYGVIADNVNNKLMGAHEVISAIENNPESVNVLRDIITTTGLSIRQLADKVYEMTPKTLSSYKEDGKHFPTRSLEISVKLKFLYSKSGQIFNTTGDFNQWMLKECYGLDGRVPMNLLNTSSGIDLVYEELLRIEFGATA